MTVNREELRERYAQLIFKRASPKDYFWGMTGTLADKACRFEELYSYKDADYLLSLIYDLFGGEANFDAVLKLVEQTRGVCPECGGRGKIITAASHIVNNHYPFPDSICNKCHGSGLGEVRIEKLKVE